MFYIFAVYLIVMTFDPLTSKFNHLYSQVHKNFKYCEITQTV